MGVARGRHHSIGGADQGGRGFARGFGACGGGDDGFEAGEGAGAGVQRDGGGAAFGNGVEAIDQRDEVRRVEEIDEFEKGEVVALGEGGEGEFCAEEVGEERGEDGIYRRGAESAEGGGGFGGR